MLTPDDKSKMWSIRTGLERGEVPTKRTILWLLDTLTMQDKERHEAVALRLNAEQDLELTRKRMAFLKDEILRAISAALETVG
jgi:hypothetical protein